MRPIDRAVEAHLTRLSLGTDFLPCEGCGECIAIDTEAVTLSAKDRGGGPWETAVYCPGCGPSGVPTPRLGADQFVARVTLTRGVRNAASLSPLRLVGVEVEARSLAGLGDVRQTREDVPDAHLAAEGY